MREAFGGLVNTGQFVVRKRSTNAEAGIEARLLASDVAVLVQVQHSQENR